MNRDLCVALVEVAPEDMNKFQHGILDTGLDT